MRNRGMSITRRKAMSGASSTPSPRSGKSNVQPWIDSSHPRIKKFLGSEKSAVGKLRQIVKIEKEETADFLKRVFRVLHDNIFQNIIDALLELNMQSIKEAKAKQNFWGFMKQKNVKESDVELIIWCLEKLIIYESKIIKEGWEETRLYELLSKFLVHFNRYSLRIKVFKLLIHIIGLKFPDNPNANGDVYQQAELLCRVPLVSDDTNNDNNDNNNNNKNQVSNKAKDEVEEESSDSSESDSENEEGSRNMSKDTNRVARKHIFRTLKEFETKTSKGDSFLDYCSKRWSLPGKNVVETQNRYDEIESKNKATLLNRSDDSDVVIPLHDHLDTKSFNSIIKTYERLHPFLSLLIASFDWTPYYNDLKRMIKSSRDDSLNIKTHSFTKKKSGNTAINLASYVDTFPFLIAIDEHEQSSKDNVKTMLNCLLQHVQSINHLQEPDKLQFWYFTLYNYIFPIIYPNINFGFTRFSDGLIKKGQKLSSKCLITETPHGLQKIVVKFLTNSLRLNYFSRLIVGDVKRTQNVLEIFNIFISTPNLVVESQASVILGVYRSWIISKECPLTRVSIENKVEIHFNVFIAQACAIIEMSKLHIKNNASTGFETTFSVAMNLLQSISTSDYIYTRDFQLNIQQLLHTVAKISRNTTNVSAIITTGGGGNYVTRSTLAVFKLLVLTKRLDFETWSYVYSEMPGILINPAAIKAVGIVLVCLTRTILNLSYTKHKVQMHENIRKNAIEAKSFLTPTITKSKSMKKSNLKASNKKLHARLNFPKSIITSFDVNNLKYMFESTDAAYKVLDQAKSKTNYWDDENNYFYQALYEIFQDVHTVEEKKEDKDDDDKKSTRKDGGADDEGDNEQKGASKQRKSSLYGQWANKDISNSAHLFILWDRLLHVFSCGKHCEIWKTRNYPKGFETIVLQIIYMIRAWLRIQEQVAATYKRGTKFITPLVSTVIDLFGPWLLNACLHDFEEHLYDYSGKFEGGKAMAFSVICILVSIRTGEIISRERLFEIYSCIGYGLSFPDNSDLSVVHSILSHSMDIFSTGHDGVSTLIPSYLYSIDYLIHGLSKKEYNKLTKHLRGSIVSILSSIFCHAALFAKLDSNALVHSLLTRSIHLRSVGTKENTRKSDNIEKSLMAPKYLLRLSHGLKLLLKVLSYESDPFVMSQIMHALSTMFQHETRRLMIEKASRPVNLFESMKLIDILYDDALRQQLRDFSEKQYSDENVDFWIDVEKFHASTITASYNKESSDRAVAVKLGGLIHKTYIEKNSEREVNISSKNSDAIQSLQLTNDDNDDINMSFFDEAQQEIYDLIERDIYPRFVNKYNDFHNNSQLHIINSFIQIIESVDKKGISSKVVLQALSSLIFIAKGLENEDGLGGNCKQIVTNVIQSLTKTVLTCIENLKVRNLEMPVDDMWSIVQKISRALKVWTMLQKDDSVVENVLEILGKIIHKDGLSARKDSTHSYLTDKKRSPKSKTLAKSKSSQSSSSRTAAINQGNLHRDDPGGDFGVKKTAAELKALYEAQTTVSHLFRYFKAPAALIRNGGYRTNVVEHDTDASKALFFTLNGKIFSISELPLVNGDIERCFSRIIMRDANGKFSWDFDYLRDIKQTYGHVPLKKVSVETDIIDNGNSVEDVVLEMVGNGVHESRNEENEDNTLHNLLIEAYAKSDIPKSSTYSNRLEDLINFTINKFDSDCDESQTFRAYYETTRKYLEKNVDADNVFLDKIESMGLAEKNRFSKLVVKQRDSYARNDDEDDSFSSAYSSADHRNNDKNESITSVTTFDRCRQFLSDIGFIGPNQLKEFIPLEDNKRLRTFLRSLDRANPRHTTKVGVVYVGQGQTTQVEIMQNTHGSLAYDKFVSGLGRDEQIGDLISQGRYTGGLDATEHGHALYYDDPTVEIIYHVLTWLPLKENDKQQIRRKRHIGNDTVQIVWCDNERAYDVRTFISKVTDVFIVLLPICPYKFRQDKDDTNVGGSDFAPKLLRVEIYCRTDTISFGPLQDGMIIHADLAPMLARQTALNAIAAVRGVQQLPFQRRVLLIDEILNKFQQVGVHVVDQLFVRDAVSLSYV